MKKVTLSFSAMQRTPGEKSAQAGDYAGTLRLDSGAYVLCYSEGAGGAGVVIRAQADCSAVKAERFCAHRSCLRIEKGKTTNCAYKTDFGDIMLEISAKSIDITDTGCGVNFDFSYDISQNGKPITQCSVRIKCKYV